MSNSINLSKTVASSKKLPSKVAKSFGVNSVALLFVFIVALISLQGPIHGIINEQKRLDLAKQELAAKQAEMDYYQGETGRWSDDKFIISYEREHHQMIMPGELAMHVTNPEAAGHDKDLENAMRVQKDANSDLQKQFDEYKIPWYERIESGVNKKSEENL